MFLWHVFSHFYLPYTSCECFCLCLVIFYMWFFSLFATRFEVGNYASWGPKHKMIVKSWWQVLTKRAYPTQKSSKNGSGKSIFLLWWSRGNFVTLRNVLWITLIYGRILFSLVTYNMILSYDMAYGGLYVTMIMQFIYLLLNFCCNQNDNDTSKYNFLNKLNMNFF